MEQNVFFEFEFCFFVDEFVFEEVCLGGLNLERIKSVVGVDDLFEDNSADKGTFLGDFIFLGGDKGTKSEAFEPEDFGDFTFSSTFSGVVDFNFLFDCFDSFDFSGVFLGDFAFFEDFVDEDVDEGLPKKPNKVF